MSSSLGSHADIGLFWHGCSVLQQELLKLSAIVIRLEWLFAPLSTQCHAESDEGVRTVLL